MYQALITIEQRPRNQYHPIAIAKRAQGFDNPSSREYLIPLFIDNQYILVILSYGVNNSTSKTDGQGFVEISLLDSATFFNNLTLAITNAVLSNTSILETNTSCPTGDCSFPLISSLGFCSNCIDITQSLQHSSECTERPVDRAGNENETVIDCNYWLPPSSSGLNYSVSNYGELRNGSLNLSWERISADLFGPSFLTIFLSDVEDSSGLVERFQSPFALQNGHVIPSSLAKIALIKTAPLTSSLSAGFVGTAHICALSVCARKYFVWMTSGLLRTEIISTHYGNLTWQPNRDHIFLYTFNNFAFEAREPAAIVQEDIVDEFNFTSGMFDALSGVLEGNVTFSDNPSLSRPATSMLQYGLNASSNITATMDRVATAMTNTLRDISNLTVQGLSGSMELYVRISWPWLALPVLSVILETILLISVITVTRRHRLPIWKTSELALLFHGLDFSLDDGVRRHKVSEMEEAATALRVRLGRGPRGDLQLQRKLD